jgi:FkbM family methyltransferase
MIRKILFYIPKILLSTRYEKSLHRKSPRLDPQKFSHLLRAIRQHLLSPRRNGYPDLTKRAIAAYYLQPNDYTVDVGAHIGGYTSFYADLVGPKGKVYSYEAHPLIFKRLQKRFKNRPEVATTHCAVSNASHRKLQMKIYPDAIEPECATVEKALMNEERMPGRTALIDVECQSLNSLLNEPIRLVKIDVEGHEHAVIEGATELINRQKPVLLFEYGYVPNKFEPHTIHQVEQLGYQAYDCTTRKRVHPDHIALEATDLVAVPKEKTEELENLLSIL